MALICCPECARQISDSAAQCPQCGAPVGKSGSTAPSSPPSSGPPATATPGKRRTVSPVLIAILIAVVGGFGYVLYQQQAAEAAHEQEQQAAEAAHEQALAMQRAAEEAEAKRKADQRAQVLQNPNGFFDVSEVVYFDKGIINDYRQLSAFTLLNKSPYPLHEMNGTIEWVKDNGESAGSTPFSLKGSIPAGDTKKFSKNDGTLESGTLQSDAANYRLKFEHVAIVQ